MSYESNDDDSKKKKKKKKNKKSLGIKRNNYLDNEKSTRGRASA